MMFTALRLASAFLIEPELLEDDRGFFARTWCAREFTAHGLNPALVQCNISFNRRKGTLRGMHFQAAPHEEARLVQCSMGSIYDVIIDLRPESATYKQHLAVVLSAENHLMLYVPEGFAHGFQTLEDNTQVFYQMSQYYSPAHSRGVRWNDPAFGIPWPLDQPIMLPRDQNYPDFAEAVYR
ncbi:MAG: dTDP-4-dehydrorhamnose 3,5-epimerase [Gemmatimonadetes bacterium]|nr:MAG: dTDP-4-dehydrorhamnose 3,5-epimerase [Gemmatimonadota bacterium]